MEITNFTIKTNCIEYVQYLQWEFKTLMPFLYSLIIAMIISIWIIMKFEGKK